MTGGGRDAQPPPVNGGEFLLSLLQKPQLQPHTPPPQQLPQQMQQLLSIDPAVAAVGPSVPFLTTAPSPWTSSNSRDVSDATAATPHLWAHNLSSSPSTPMPVPPHLLGLPQNHWSLPMNNPPIFGNDHSQQRLGFPGIDVRGGPNYTTNISGASVHNQVHQQEPQQQKLVFGSLNENWQLNHSAKEREFGGLSNGFDKNRQFVSANYEHDILRGKQLHHIGNYRSTQSSETRTLPHPPPGFSRRNEEDDRLRKFFSEDGTSRQRLGLSGQLDHPGPPPGSKLQSASALGIEESLMDLHMDDDDDDDDADNGEDFGQPIVDSLLHEGETDGKKDKKHHRDKDIRSDKRGQKVLSQRMRILKRQMLCRSDIDRLNAPFLAIYESLIPPEEEKAKQTRLFALLEKLVTKEWPAARLYLYGSCANSFGVSKSDIDVCLAFQEADIKKSEVLLKLADILQSDNLQNVQALTHARVPIVKLMHPETGISCDICINNVLAVVNTKLLRDYARIDARLRQLAFIVKHWAKSRGVNATYQGTLSSYAYVLMCIHFLQQRRPAILPCLQEMEPTYAVTVDDVECAYYDRVEKLGNYGSRNKDTIARLVWGFFNYWAYRHDYTNAVISVRTGGIISKREKDWTRRIGNDRHLICIEDPFEISHDLGRVVDKFSIKVLREEFERAAEIMQYDPNPCVTLFEPYVPSS